MNNKGFAITTILYGILILFMMLLASMLALLGGFKNNMDKLVDADNGARDILDDYYDITLDNGGATSKGTEKLYGIVEGGIYLDSEYLNKMTDSENPINVPSKDGYTFKGYYTKKNGEGTLVLTDNGYLSGNFDEKTFSGDVTFYAYLEAEPPTKPTIDNPTNGIKTCDSFALTLSTTTSVGVDNWQYTYSSSATDVGSDANSTWVKYTNSASDTFVTPTISSAINKTIYVRACNIYGNCSTSSSTKIYFGTIQVTYSCPSGGTRSGTTCSYTGCGGCGAGMSAVATGSCLFRCSSNNGTCSGTKSCGSVYSCTAISPSGSSFQIVGSTYCSTTCRYYNCSYTATSTTSCN